MIDIKEKKIKFQIGLVFLFLLICRLVAMYFVPLMDSTEARYGEIAREMLETRNWITLLHHYGVPFLAKPPLSTWLSVLSMHFFGINELALRLPSLVLSIAMLVLLGQIAKKQASSFEGLTTVLFLAGSLYFYLNAGALMTDASLLFCTTLAMIAFWRATIEQSKIWTYVFFTALGIGLLAKGPVALVLSIVPSLLWILLCKKRHRLQHLPLIKGSLLTLAIAFPWYLLAELNSPGFLKYFIIGEHFNRFFVSSWQGNQYGFSHAKPFGFIWIYFFIGIFPWSIFIVYWLINEGKKEILRKNWIWGPREFEIGNFRDSFQSQNDRDWLCYLVLWFFFPLVFFSFSKNIIYTYSFLSLPAAALLFAEAGKRLGFNKSNLKKILPLTASVGCLFLVATLILIVNPGTIAKSQKPIITAWRSQHPKPGSKLIYWASRLEYSAQFYSQGFAVATRNLDQLRVFFEDSFNQFLVISKDEITQIPQDIIAQFRVVRRVKMTNSVQLLLRRTIL